MLRNVYNCACAFYRVCQLRPVHAEDDFSATLEREQWCVHGGLGGEL